MIYVRHTLKVRHKPTIKVCFYPSTKSNIATHINRVIDASLVLLPTQSSLIRILHCKLNGFAGYHFHSHQVYCRPELIINNQLYYFTFAFDSLTESFASKKRLFLRILYRKILKCFIKGFFEPGFNQWAWNEEI